MTGGDPRLTERLVTNLLDNAIRYSQAGGWVRIHTGTIDGLATLRIENSGQVIPPAEVARLFGPFQRLTPDRTGGASSGSGLGLSIVNAITVAHRAWLWAQPRPEGGLNIEIRFSAALTARDNYVGEPCCRQNDSEVPTTPGAARGGQERIRL